MASQRPVESFPVVYSSGSSEYLGEDGDWIEGEEWSPKSRAAERIAFWEFEVLVDDEGGLMEEEAGEAVSKLASRYVSVDLMDLQSLSVEAWEDLRAQWVLSKGNGWTSPEANSLMRQEVHRRLPC